MACSSDKPRGTADYVISTGRPTTECCAELGLDSKTVNKWAQKRRRRPQAGPGRRQRCQKRPSKGRVPLDGTIGTPPPQTKGDRVGRHHAALAEGVTPRGPGRRCSLPKLRGIGVVPVYFHHTIRTRLKQHFPAVGSDFP